MHHNHALILLFTCLTIHLSASDTLIWIGNNNADFFEETNWEWKSDHSTPEGDIIHQDSLIHFHLEISDARFKQPVSQLVFAADSFSMTLQNTTINIGFIRKGKLELSGKSKLTLSAAEPMKDGAEINLASPASWVCFPNENPDITRLYFYQFKANGNRPKLYESMLLDQYHAGSVFRLFDPAHTPLILFSGNNLDGDSAGIRSKVVVQGEGIPANISGKMASFRLERGYMATLAANEDGTGLSKVYIASEKDLAITPLPAALKNKVKFIRVLPWNWPLKKGVGGNVDGLNQSWFYNWGNGSESTLIKEFAPMAWGKNGANDDNDITLYRNKQKATHVLGFNESDNCNDQSGQYGSLCVIDTAVKYYRNLMKTGLRLGSPAPRENGPFNWLSDFMEEATRQDVRIDVMCVHWYDWGNNPKVNTNPTPEKVFTRFKNYLQRVYDKYGLPIWITEFNANTYRNNAIQEGFLKLALPYLEGLSYVERYAYFQPNSDVADYFDSEGNYTNIGMLYRDHESTPAVKDSTLLSPSNLNDKLASIPQSLKKRVVEDDYISQTFPNPFSDIIYLHHTFNKLPVKVFDIHGTVVFTGAVSGNMLNLKHLPKGVYILSIENHTFLKLCKS